MKLNLRDKIIECVKLHKGEKLTARQIAEWVFKTYPAQCEAKRKNSRAQVIKLESDEALLQQIVAEIGANRPDLQKRDSHLKTTEERPRKYYYSVQSDADEVIEAEKARPVLIGEKKRLEHDLYPILSRFLWGEYRLYSQRIDEKRSSNKNGKNGNKWLHPDVVGMEDLTYDWHPQIKKTAELQADKRTKLWSFEVKLLINQSNVREAFFQTVSNSSWANYGYLVAAELTTDVRRELDILCALHGIGFILLSNEFDKSQMLIPAKERSDIDWDTANRLIKENKDFEAFIDEVTRFYQTGKTKPSYWGLEELLAD